MDYIQILIETIIGFIALFILTKILGKSQITQITAFDFIAALILGELVGNGLYDDKIGVTHVLFAIFLWGSLIYITEIISQKYKGTRGLLEGQPTIVIKNGKLNRENMKKVKLDINQLQHLLRSKGVFSMQDAEFAVLETDGTISVMKNPNKDIPTADDWNMQPKPFKIAYTLIIDGEIIWDNLQEIGHDEKWLIQQLQIQGHSSYKEIFYAEYQEGEALYVNAY
ncbi:DUF421 domain-containing protein [Bacillaceae bacterium S4-13-58]